MARIGRRERRLTATFAKVIVVRADDDPFVLQACVSAVERGDHVAASAARGVRVERRGERQALEKCAVVTRGAQPHLPELTGDVIAGAPFAVTARQAAVQGIIGQIADVSERTGGAADDVGGSGTRLVS